MWLFSLKKQQHTIQNKALSSPIVQSTRQNWNEISQLACNWYSRENKMQPKAAHCAVNISYWHAMFISCGITFIYIWWQWLQLLHLRASGQKSTTSRSGPSECWPFYLSLIRCAVRCGKDATRGNSKVCALIFAGFNVRGYCGSAAHPRIFRPRIFGHHSSSQSMTSCVRKWR